MNVIAYSNFDRKSENSQTSNDALINVLKQEYNIDETYHLDVSYEANENGKDDIKYYWSKTEKNGCQNFYDALSVRIDGTTKEIVLFNRFNDVAENSEIIITETDTAHSDLADKTEYRPSGAWEGHPAYFGRWYCSSPGFQTVLGSIGSEMRWEPP